MLVNKYEKSNCINGIVEDVYKASLDKNIWGKLLKTIISEIGASAGFYAGLDVRSGRGRYWYAEGHDLRIQKLYNEVYLERDPTLREILRNSEVVNLFGANEFNNIPDYKKFHQEFLLPHGLGPILSAVISRQGSIFSFIGFQRKLGESDFSKDNANFVQALLPHLKLGDTIAAKLATLSDARKLLMTALDRIEHGIVLIDEKGYINLTNKNAEKMLEEGNIIQANFGRIKFIGLDETVIQREIGAISATKSSFLQTPHNVSIKILPASTEYEDIGEGGFKGFIVFISTTASRNAAENDLKKIYSLTNTEVKILEKLAAGLKIEEICSTFSISMSTVKTHLQHIFQKTGVNRQVDLVRIYYEVPRSSFFRFGE
jgi:DNA-binding CsgD family transcriptional regulator